MEACAPPFLSVWVVEGQSGVDITSRLSSAGLKGETLRRTG